MDRDAAVNPSFGDQSSEEQIWVKNNDYHDAFHSVMRIAHIQMVLILILSIAFFVYVKNTKRNDLFFAEAVGGRQMQMVGLSLPNMGKAALTNWVIQAATKIMTFGFNDIDEQFALSRSNFTEAGWKSFYKAMEKSELIESVIKAQQLITAIPTAPPVLMQEGLFEGKYSWVFEMQMLVTFRSGSVKRVSTKTVRVIVEQVPTSDNPNGLGINEWYIY